MIGTRGPAGFLLVAAALVALGACTPKPRAAVVRPPPPAAAPAPVIEDEPVPVAAPRQPVETGGVTPPPGPVPGPRGGPPRS